jgi:hypothetical protein
MMDDRTRDELVRDGREVWNDMPPHPKTPKRKVVARLRRANYLTDVRSCGCILTGRTQRVEAAHIRYGDLEGGKPPTGMGRKPDDCWVLPLCAELHRELPGSQHAGNERDWWAQFGIDPIVVARALWNNRDHLEIMRDLVVMHRPAGAAMMRVVEILGGARRTGRGDQVPKSGSSLRPKRPPLPPKSLED